MDLLQSSIFKTLCYFDSTNFPLTKEELFRFLWCPPTIKYEEFVQKMDAMDALNVPGLQNKWSFYFLHNRGEIVEDRRKRIVPTELFLKRARLAARLIAWVPFLRAIFVCNSVGAETATEKSDVDFFIVSEQGKIWFVRFFTNLILRLFNLRTYGVCLPKRICLSFYVDAKTLDLSPFRIADDDIHLAYWLHQMIPVYDPNNIYSRFLQENDWTNTFLPYIKSESGAEYIRAVRVGKFLVKLKQFLEGMLQGKIGQKLEQQMKNWQWEKLKPSLKEKAKVANNHVVLQDTILKFHERDTRADYRDRWLIKINDLVK